MEHRQDDNVLIKIAGDVGYIRSKVDELTDSKKDHDTRLRALETTGSIAVGEKTSNNNRERFINGCISVLFAACISLLCAYIDRQPTGENNAIPPTQINSDFGNRSPRPAGGR